MQGIRFLHQCNMIIHLAIFKFSFSVIIIYFLYRDPLLWDICKYLIMFEGINVLANYVFSSILLPSGLYYPFLFVNPLILQNIIQRMRLFSSNGKSIAPIAFQRTCYLHRNLPASMHTHTHKHIHTTLNIHRFSVLKKLLQEQI